MRKLIFTILIATGVLSSCGLFNEELPDCHLSVAFKYDYNMLSVDAFHTQVDKVTLYVFDEDGIFLFEQTGTGPQLAAGNYKMELPVPAGKYKLMAWAGVHNSYDVAPLTAGLSTIEEVTLKLKREESLVVDKELEPLWYGEILDVDFAGVAGQTPVINLIKDTNKLRFVFQGQTSAWQMNVDDYRYQVIESNGYLDYQNALLDDDALSYEPYYQEQKEAQAALVELNTMRLMADRETRFVVTHKASGKVVFDINLIHFLEMTEMDRYEWGAQEYFDRQDTYAIVFFLNGTAEESWVSPQVEVNGWTWYFQEEEAR